MMEQIFIYIHLILFGSIVYMFSLFMALTTVSNDQISITTSAENVRVCTILGFW